MVSPLASNFQKLPWPLILLPLKVPFVVPVFAFDNAAALVQQQLREGVQVVAVPRKAAGHTSCVDSNERVRASDKTIGDKRP